MIKFHHVSASAFTSSLDHDQVEKNCMLSLHLMWFNFGNFNLSKSPGQRLPTRPSLHVEVQTVNNQCPQEQDEQEHDSLCGTSISIYTEHTHMEICTISESKQKLKLQSILHNNNNTFYLRCCSKHTRTPYKWTDKNNRLIEKREIKNNRIKSRVCKSSKVSLGLKTEMETVLQISGGERLKALVPAEVSWAGRTTKWRDEADLTVRGGEWHMDEVREAWRKGVIRNWTRS